VIERFVRPEGLFSLTANARVRPDQVSTWEGRKWVLSASNGDQEIMLAHYTLVDQTTQLAEAEYESFAVKYLVTRLTSRRPQIVTVQQWRNCLTKTANNISAKVPTIVFCFNGCQCV
jgi:hypothetical protein